MKKSGVKAISVTLIVMLALMLGASSVFAGQKVITVYVDNSSQIQFDVNPIVENGRTLVPMRAIAEALGFSVQWNAKSGKIYCVGEAMYCTEMTIGKKEARRYQLQPDENNLEQKYEDMIVTGEIQVKTMDAAAKVVSGRTMVPLRFISEVFGCEVQWDGNLNKINIVTDPYNPDCYMEISETVVPVQPQEVIIFKEGDSVQLIDFGTVFLGQVKAVRGDQVQVYWYDITDWTGNSVSYRHQAGDGGGLLGGARLYQTTWIEAGMLTKSK